VTEEGKVRTGVIAVDKSVAAVGATTVNTETKEIPLTTVTKQTKEVPVITTVTQEAGPVVSKGATKEQFVGDMRDVSNFSQTRANVAPGVKVVSEEGKVRSGVVAVDKSVSAVEATTTNTETKTIPITEVTKISKEVPVTTTITETAGAVVSKGATKEVFTGAVENVSHSSVTYQGTPDQLPSKAGINTKAF